MIPVVILELRFRDVERQVLAANLMIAANDAALDERPEALNRVRVDRANNPQFIAKSDFIEKDNK